MCRYNQWMNETLYAVCQQIPDQDRHSDQGAFFKSIHGTLNHILVADKLWLGRFTHNAFKINSLDQELHHDFKNLEQDRIATDNSINEWFASLPEEALAAPLTYTSHVKSEQRTALLWKLVSHFFNHQTHHRGQLTTLISQYGIDPGVTDLVYVPET